MATTKGREETTMMTVTKQQTLNDACRAASRDGVGFVGVVNRSGSVTIRRDEEHAASSEHKFSSLADALAYLDEWTD